MTFVIRPTLGVIISFPFDVAPEYSSTQVSWNQRNLCGNPPLVQEGYQPYLQCPPNDPPNHPHFQVLPPVTQQTLGVDSLMRVICASEQSATSQSPDRSISRTEYRDFLRQMQLLLLRLVALIDLLAILDMLLHPLRMERGGRKVDDDRQKRFASDFRSHYEWFSRSRSTRQHATIYSNQRYESIRECRYCEALIGRGQSLHSSLRKCKTPHLVICSVYRRSTAFVFIGWLMTVMGNEYSDTNICDSIDKPNYRSNFNHMREIPFADVIVQ